ncbi:hypothetical protein [Flavobacterium sp.]|uniref:hypothetical protein n=1 Tax=Flavobacterium sp. TaxID=239 RepID=UPI0039E64A83
MKNFLLSIILLSTLSLLSGCDPHDDQENSQPQNSPNSFSENFGNEVSRDFIGQVVDINSLPVANAVVAVGTSTVQTDANGVFIIDGAEVYEQFAYITVKKPGYIDGSRAMVPTNGKNNVKVMLIPSAPIQTITSGSSAEVALPSGTKVTFDGAFEDENGNPYSGNVSVSMYHLESSNENISLLMPGMLYAKTDTGQEAILKTFGMLNVELRGNSGQKLQIAGGHTAEIEMMIDNSQLATAPSTIPLWHFDEALGYWIQEGTATRSGNKYIGQVSHFSWWNCDAFFATVSLSVTVVGVNGNPLPNTVVGLIANSSLSAVSGYTDNNGTISGMIPQNQTLTLNVYSDCGIAYTTTIGPFNGDTVLPTIQIAGSSTTSTLVTGVLKKCDGSAVTNGYVVMSRLGGDQVINVTNGTFSFNSIFCSSVTTLSLRGVDLDNLQTVSVNHAITTPTTNVGNLTACNSISNYVSYKLDDQPVTYLFTGLFGGYNSPTLLFSAGAMSTTRLHVVGNTLVPGVYDSSVFQLFDTLGPYHTYANENITYNLIAFGNVGELLHMTLSGTFDDNYGVTHTVSGTIHVTRNQ